MKIVCQATTQFLLSFVEDKTEHKKTLLALPQLKQK